jgi:hypothetical protein
MVQPYHMAVAVYRTFYVSERLKRAATALPSQCHSDYRTACDHYSAHYCCKCWHVCVDNCTAALCTVLSAARLVGALYMHQQCIRHVVVHERSQYMEVRLSNA